MTKIYNKDLLSNLYNNRLLVQLYSIYLIIECMGKLIENYSLQNQIGHGTYSTVFRAINLKTKQEVAMKQVRTQKFKQYPKLQEGTYNEISILTNLPPSPHIIKYIDMLKTAHNFYFVYEYCNGGTLENLLKDKKHLSEKQALTYFSQILEAFRVLNRHNIMHRDLKPQNILLHDGIIKLADFGFCKPLESEDEISKTMLGSPIYMAPEILRGESYSMKADIWSLGVVLFRMLYGFCPFESSNIGKLIMIIDEQEFKVPQKPLVSPEVVRLIRRMITKNQSLRVEWSQILQYNVHNGQLYRNGIRQRYSFLKCSNTPSDTSTTYTLPKSPQQQLNTWDIKSRKSGQSPNIKGVSVNKNNDRRNAYTITSNFHESFKKDQFVKHHMKCLEVMSLAVSLAAENKPAALALSYVMALNVDKELAHMLDSLHKECNYKKDQPTIKNFIFIVEAQLSELKTLTIYYRQSLREELEMPIQLIQSHKRALLKQFVVGIKKEHLEELILASQVVDYIMEQLIIHRQTFEKMSRQKLLSNILTKTEVLQ